MDMIKKNMGGKALNLTGQKFGRLTVIERAEDYIDKKGRHRVRWKCNCDCGTKDVIVFSFSLTGGSTKSCGCLHNEQAAKNVQKAQIHNRKYNKYDLSGDYGVGYTTKGEKFFFDLEDYDIIKDICWSKNKKGYICGRDIKNKKNVNMHQLIMADKNPNSDYFIDHIHADYKHDNRKCNLRLATPKDNAHNRKIFKTNLSGVTGVRWIEKLNKWFAFIKKDGKDFPLGYFINKDDAIKARKKAEKELWGEFVYNPYNDSLKLEDQNGIKKRRISIFYMNGLALTLEGR